MEEWQDIIGIEEVDLQQQDYDELEDHDKEAYDFMSGYNADEGTI